MLPKIAKNNDLFGELVDVIIGNKVIVVADDHQVISSNLWVTKKIEIYQLLPIIVDKSNSDIA